MIRTWFLHVWLCAHPGELPGQPWGECRTVAPLPMEGRGACIAIARTWEQLDLHAWTVCKLEARP